MAGEPGYTVDEARADAREWSKDVPIGARGWRSCCRILDARIVELEAALRPLIGPTPPGADSRYWSEKINAAQNALKG